MAFAPLAPAGQEGKPGIMVVDDEEQVLDSVRSVIEYKLPKVNAWFFSDPMDAVEAFEYLDVALLVTDFKMYHMNGFELIDALRRRKPDLPAFMITAFNDPQVLGLRAEAVKVPMLSKPFSVDDFVGLVKQQMPAAQ